jgi:hypothetical protein
MDALEFLRQKTRMCNSYNSCVGCPLQEEKCRTNNLTTDEECKRIISAIEQWSKEHPRKTRQSVFLEQWPNCMLDSNGAVGICPRNVEKNCSCKLNCAGECPDCRREFWMQEVE